MHYIHVKDVGFPTGFRRLGPFGSEKQAEEQAENDVAAHGWDVAIYTGAESDSLLKDALARVAEHA